MNVVRHLGARQAGDNVRNFRDNLFHERLRIARNLYKKDLVSHYGCVNAIEFSAEGELLVSGEFSSGAGRSQVEVPKPESIMFTFTFFFLVFASLVEGERIFMFRFVFDENVCTQHDTQPADTGQQCVNLGV